MENTNSENVLSFYNTISKQYSESVKRCVPFYEEMLESVLMFLPENFKPKNILELGSGTGNLTKLIIEKFPSANITAVDISQECIEECKSLINFPVNYVKADFKEINFAENSFDLIVSSISIHHINDIEKQKLFNKLFKYQTPGAILSFCDQFSAETKEIYLKYISEWKKYAFSKGSNDAEWEMWMQHQNDHDYHSTLENHTNWLKQVGYKNVDCTKRHLLWTTVFAIKL